MEEGPFAKCVHAVVFLAICGAILLIGWREPLRYRFMSAEQIAAENAPPLSAELQPPPRVATPPPRAQTLLERAPRK